MIEISEKDRRALKMIVGYLQMGGDPNMRFITDFCAKTGISMDDVIAYASKENHNHENALRKLGLL